jgi:hypothetical protein
MNPEEHTTLPPFPEIVAAVITHLPNRKGYHAQRFEVIQASLESLGRDIPLYAWDNGSDAKFREWLVKDLRPEYLTLTPNIGKASARTAILRTFPSNTIVCMSDDDILFTPGWLETQLEILRGFPNVGAVSGCPVRTQARWGIVSTLNWAKENAILKYDRFIPDEYEYDFCRSIGRDYTQHMSETAGEKDYLIEYNGLKAYAMAHHMQFIGYAGKLSVLGLWTRNAMRAEQSFDVAIDRLGLLRLTTIERYTRHIGNILET